MGYSLASIFSGDFSNERKGKFEWGTVDMSSGNDVNVTLKNTYTQNPAILTGVQNDLKNNSVSIINITSNSFTIKADSTIGKVSWLVIGDVI